MSAIPSGISFTFDGVTIKAEPNQGYESVSFGQGATFDINFFFDKFFPYANGNGDPIYNEDNGTELRDPETGREK